jgi:hypothetical protein
MRRGSRPIASGIEEAPFVEAGPSDHLVDGPQDPRTQTFVSHLLSAV